MNIFKKITFTFGFLISSLLLSACQSHEAANEIKVGTISGPETQLMEIAKQVAKQNYGLDIQIVEFSDYNLPNIAVSDGSLDANMVEHKPYLDALIKNEHYALTTIGRTFIYPVGIYSQKIKNLNQLQTGAIVAIPNDPSNEARALLLLAKAGVITLKPNAGVTAMPQDIVSNPKNIQIKEIDAAQLPRVLPDVTLAVINTNFAVPAGLYPSRDALFREDANSPYANVVVVRIADANSPKLHELVEALHSPQVVQAAQQIFKGQAIAAW
jgi:D-methionine transport system substrate-binding protein